MKTPTFGIFATALAVCCVGPVAVGQAPDPSNQIAGEVAEPQIPDELQDRAFDQYVDMVRLQEAWDRLSAAALADAGLQLAEGERVLFRSHKALPADAVLKAAANIAVEKRDKQTLERLAKAARVLGSWAPSIRSTTRPSGANHRAAQAV